MDIEITVKVFNQFRDLVYRMIGVKLSDSKKVLVGSRLRGRLMELGFSSLAEYMTFLESCQDVKAEIDLVINKITTNETSFFREDHHFQYLRNVIFPLWDQNKKRGMPSLRRIWSSACSSGEEPYSIAMTALEYYKNEKSPNIKILASDINTEVLAIAQEGRYKASSIEHKIPEHYIEKYFKKIDSSTYQVCESVRRMIVFKRVNLADTRYPIKDPLDLIFCRNVMIYFDDAMKNHIISQFHRYLDKDGWLLIGHSENLFNYANLFVSRAATIYNKVIK